MIICFIITVILSFIFSIIDCYIVYQRIKKKNIVFYFLFSIIVSSLFIVFERLVSHSNDLFSVLIVIVLVSISIVDHYLMIIPDSYNIFIGITSLVKIIYCVLQKQPQMFYGKWDLISGLSITILLMLITYLISKKKEIMGFGDLKLLLSVVIMIGLINQLLVLFVSCLVAVVVEVVVFHLKRKMIPFGPYLAFGIMIVILFQPLIRKYINLLI